MQYYLSIHSWCCGEGVGEGEVGMDKFDFIKVVDDIFDECETKEQMDSRLKQMREIIQQQYVLKVGFISALNALKSM